MENVSSAQLPKNADPEEYDVVILGGGTGSTIAAWTFAKQGQRVAAIDRKYVGGSCPNIACLPSKNIIHSAKVASYFRTMVIADPNGAKIRAVWEGFMPRRGYGAQPGVLTPGIATSR